MTYVEVIQVTANLLGRLNHAVDVQIRTVGKRREDLRQHGVLNGLCYLQLTLHTLLTRVQLYQTADVLCTVIHDIYEQRQAHQHHYGYVQAYAVQVGKQYVFGDNYREVPPCGVNHLVQYQILASGNGVGSAYYIIAGR